MKLEADFVIEAGTTNFQRSVRNTCKMMCVTTNSALLVIALAVVSMYFSGLSAFWFVVTLPACRFQEYLTTTIYPMSAVMFVVLLLSPMFAVAGEVKFGNLRILSGVIPLSVCGFVSAVVLTVICAVIGAVVISYFLLLGYLLLLLVGGIFQANAIQLGRDNLGDINSSERSSFVHWYYWATYVPTFAAALILVAEYWTSSPLTYTLLSIVLLLGMIVFSTFLLVVCVVCYVRSKNRSQNVRLPPPVVINPVAQICRVTRLALRNAPKSGRLGFLARLDHIRQSVGGVAKDEEVDNVTSFWLLLALMASLYGFFLWDDMWAMPFASAVLERTNSVAWSLSSQATTSVIVFIAVPVYQIVVRPLLGKFSPPLVWRILAGLILQIIALAVVTWSGVATAARFGSDVLTNICNYNFDDDVFSNGGDFAGQSIDWFVLLIPQLISGVSQLLVFPAVIELILTDAPRIMQGLLIGLWYAMLSIHVLVGVFETMACAVYYWQYYIVKIVLVLVSVITFVIIAFFYKRTKVVHFNSQSLRKVNSVENI